MTVRESFLEKMDLFIKEKFPSLLLNRLTKLTKSGMFIGFTETGAFGRIISSYFEG